MYEFNASGALVCSIPTNGTGHSCGVQQVTKLHRGYLIKSFLPSEVPCAEGLVLPLIPGEELWAPGLRAFLYAIAMIYMFLGIAIVSDMFMAAIEVITAQEKTVTREVGGVRITRKVVVWNATVANLTLMALGSSAPEILLAVIETVSELGKPVQGEGLGAATIVGSAAFNLFMITGVCIMAVPRGEGKRIEDVGVFVVTSIFSLVAYLWLLFTLRWVSPGVVEVWEAVCTLALFGALVLLSWAQDRNWFRSKAHESHASDEESRKSTSLLEMQAPNPMSRSASFTAMLRDRREHMESRSLRDATEQELHEIAEDMARQAVTEHASQMRSRAVYRINAVRAATGRGGVPMRSGSFTGSFRSLQLEHDPALQRVKLGSVVPIDALARPRAASSASSKATDAVETLAASAAEAHAGGQHSARRSTPAGEGGPPAVVHFSASAHSVAEDVGSVEIKVLRTGNLSHSSRVMYETSNGSALSGVDYVYTSGWLQFAPGEQEKSLAVPIIDDDEYEPDENFFVMLKQPSAGTVVGEPAVTSVTIIDNDVPGAFSFQQPAVSVQETESQVLIILQRTDGGSGVVQLRVWTTAVEGGAQPGVDFEPVAKELSFSNGECTHTVPVAILDCKSFDKSAAFHVHFEILNFPQCGAKYGDHRECTVTIVTDSQLARNVEMLTSLVNRHMNALQLFTSSWGEQFRAALIPGEDGEQPSAFDLISHVIAFPWKVLFAFVPPTAYVGGWATFVVSLAFVGLLTAVVKDLASLFGCCIGLPHAVTAVTFVALGTSLPDTFASRSAAINDKSADASVGNVTGSNSVNVFLGLGLPWVIASFYYSARGEKFVVPAGSLAFAVVVFCICATICFSILAVRRLWEGSELGGRRRWFTLLSAGVMVLLWVAFVLLSSLEATGVFTARW